MKRDTYIALIDCNNFFVSCERVFRPDLRNKPVAVLSSNDGCVVARSNEVKKMGIPMGIPYFQVKEKLTSEKVTLFSGNFALYGDISRRIMNIIESYSEDMEIYSIDEAFIPLGSDPLSVKKQAFELKRAIERGVGVPVSIGIAQSKTLAKLAGEKAKKDFECEGVFLLDTDSQEAYLRKFHVGEVWGVGGQTSIKLSAYGVSTAYDLAHSSDSWIRKTIGLGGLRTAEELRGKKIQNRDVMNRSKKSILSSSSFGKKTSLFTDIEESVVEHVVDVARKMRAYKLGTGYISVFIRQARSGSVRGVTSSGSRVLLSQTTDTLALVKHAVDITKELYRENIRFEKSGVLISNMVPRDSIPSHSLFGELQSSKREGLMETLDAIEKKYGKNTIYPAIMGVPGDQTWSLKRKHSSPPYTTEWGSIPKIKMK